VKLIAIVALIVSYTDFGAHDSMKDHSDTHYATIKLRVLSPKELKGRELSLMEEMPVSPRAILRKKGRRISFKMQPGYLDSHVLFSGSLEELKLLPRK